MKRYRVNKFKSAKKFNKSASRTRGANVWAGPMRGGIRL